MAKKIQTAIRYAPWLKNAIKRFAAQNKTDFSAAVNFLLTCELNRRGYFQSEYEPDIVDYSMNDDIQSFRSRPSENEKRLIFENKRQKLEIERLKKEMQEAGIVRKPTPISVLEPKIIAGDITINNEHGKMNNVKLGDVPLNTGIIKDNSMQGDQDI
jgi:hypothetical protein